MSEFANMQWSTSELVLICNGYAILWMALQACWDSR